MHLICPPKFRASIVFNSSWDGCNAQEKWKTKVMQIIRQWVLGKRLKSNNCKLGECDLQGGVVSRGGGEMGCSSWWNLKLWWKWQDWSIKERIDCLGQYQQPWALSTLMSFQTYTFSLPSKTHRSIRVHTTVLMRSQMSTLKYSKTIELHVVT